MKREDEGKSSENGELTLLREDRSGWPKSQEHLVLERKADSRRQDRGLKGSGQFRNDRVRCYH